MPDRLKSRKLWVSLVTSGIMALLAGLKIELTPETIGAIVAPAVAFILGQSV